MVVQGKKKGGGWEELRCQRPFLRRPSFSLFIPTASRHSAANAVSERNPNLASVRVSERAEPLTKKGDPSGSPLIMHYGYD